MKKLYALLVILLAGGVLAGCQDNQSNETMAQKAMKLEQGEECHLCGMIIGNFPGPKGQLYERGKSTNMKFCSTRDLLAYALDPEHKHSIQSIFVHDMAINPWEKPDDETYIDGRKAWFVTGSMRKGAMGPTLASFSSQEAAKAFIHEFGGELRRFEELTIDSL